MTNRFRSVFIIIAASAIAPALLAAPIATTTTLTAPPSSVATGTVITLTAEVKAGGEAVSPGLVTFHDGKNIIGSAQLIFAGTATIKTRLGLGAHSITATFVGTKTYGTSSSTAQPVTVTGTASTATTIGYSGSNNDYTLTGEVTSFGWAAPTGKVSFPDITSGTTYGTVALGDGAEAFQPQHIFNGGISPGGPAIGDFNGDGIPDLATNNDISGPGTVSVQLGLGDGTFQAPLSYPTGFLSQFVVTGDFNSDGLLDLAVPNAGDETISVLLGNGDGTFQPQTAYGVGVAYWPQWAAVGDFNGDGIPDLATANLYSNNIGVLLGKGDGTFQPAQNYSAGAFPSSVEVGDLRGIGIQDLVVTNFLESTISILLGNGDGTFQPQQTYGVGGEPQNTALGDFNDDGIPDIAVANLSSGNVGVLLGKGDGTFQPQQPYATNGTPNSVVAADFNGDGILDLAVPDVNTNTVSVLLGNGDGTFQTPQSYVTGTGPGAIAAGDLNGDGLPDLVSISSAVSVLLNGVTASTPPITNVSIPGTKMQTVVASYSGDTGRQPSVSQPIGLTPTSIRNLLFSSTSMPFGKVYLPQSAPLTLTVTNAGTDSVNELAVDLPAKPFVGTTTCGDSLAAGASCTVSVTFYPTETAEITSSFVVHSDAPGTPKSIALSGSGGRSLGFSATGLTFFGVLPGTTSSTQTVTVTNIGPVLVSSLSTTFNGLNPSNFGETTSCGGSLEPGASCDIGVTLTDPAGGSATALYSALLEVHSDAHGAPEKISLAGGPYTGNLMINPPNASLTQFEGEIATQVFTVTNAGSSAVTNVSVAFAGPGNYEFLGTTTCGGSLGPNQSCTVTVVFMAQGEPDNSSSTDTETVLVYSSSPGSPAKATLLGTSYGNVCDGDPAACQM